MALQLRCGGVFLSQSSDSYNKNGRLVIGGVGWGREPFLGRLHCSSNNNNSNCDAKKGVPDSNYVVPLEKSFSPSNSSCITRPLIEILRDLNKRIPHNIIKSPPNSSTFLPWYHANRMLSFYAPGWCGEVRDVIFANNGTITVVYRLTIRGSDGETSCQIMYVDYFVVYYVAELCAAVELRAHRESTGTVSSSKINMVDPVSAAEEIAFCRACARFGLGLYLYHEE